MLTEKEVLERAFLALDQLVGLQVAQKEATMAGAAEDDLRAETETISDPEGGAPEVPTAVMVSETEAYGIVSEAVALSLKGHAVEVWCDHDGAGVFIVADDEDAQEAIRRFDARRGVVWTPTEIELVARIKDQAVRNELAEFKRQMDGSLSRNDARATARKGDRTNGLW